MCLKGCDVDKHTSRLTAEIVDGGGCLARQILRYVVWIFNQYVIYLEKLQMILPYLKTALACL